MILMSWDTREQVERFIKDKASTDQLIQWCPESEVDNLVQYMKSEANRHWNINPKISFKLAEGIIALGYHYRDTSHVALGLMARGDARKSLGEFQAAWDDLQKAGRLFKWICDDVGWARTRIGLFVVSFELKKVKQVLPETVLAEAIFRREKAWHLLINLRMNLGAVHNWRSDFDEALRQLKRAVRLAQCLGPEGEAYLGNLYLNIGYTFMNKDNFRQADNYFEKAFQIFSNRQEDFGIIYIEHNRAYIAEMTGHFRKALRLLDSSLSRAVELAHFQAIQSRTYIVNCYLKLNRYIEARELVKDILKEYRSLELKKGQTTALFQLARAEAALGRYEEAKTALTSIETLYRELDVESWQSKVKTWRAIIALKENDPLVAKELTQEAPESFFSKQQYMFGTQALLIQGQALLDLGEHLQALNVANIALEVAQHHQLINFRFDAHLLLGKINEALDNPFRARRHYQAAVAAVDRMQRNLTFTLRSGFLEDKYEPLSRLFRLYVKENNIEAAFEAVERAKSQIFLGYLNSRDSLVWKDNNPRSRQLLQELQLLREQHLWFYNIAQGDSEKAKISSDEARQQLINIEKKLRSTTEQLYLHTADLQSDFDVPSLPEIQLHLDAETCLIEFYNDGSQIWAFIISNNCIEIVELSTTVLEIDTLLLKLQFNISVALKAGAGSPLMARLIKQFQSMSHQLNTKLLYPLYNSLRSFSQIVIVPYGSLHYLPFHLLFDGQRYLIEEHEITVLPAASLLVRQGIQRPHEALVLAHSHNGHVPQTITESSIVYELFSGDIRCNEQATRAVLQQPPRQVLHIAAHGEFRIDQPDLSFIQLEDGPVYADDLLQYDLSYELVTLSACETGRANIAPGDEPIGLGRGCLYAGASALLVSLWRVDDSSTVHLMKEFYESLLSGKSKSAAIRLAQCRLMAEHTALHPAFWGAFQLIGDAGSLSTCS